MFNVSRCSCNCNDRNCSWTDMQFIMDSLGLKNCKRIVANPDRKNITYKKVPREGHNVDAIQFILRHLKRKDGLSTNNSIVPLRLCGFAYKLFEHMLGTEQYFPPGSPSIPSNRLRGNSYSS